MAELLDAPKYFGNQETLMIKFDKDSEEPAGHQYFKRKRICEWSLSDFLVSNNNVSDFISNMELIRKDKRVEGAIRAFANAWYRYLEGAPGALRISTAQEAAMNSIRHAKLSEQACGVAQTDMSAVMKERQAKADIGGLGKRLRESEEKLENEPPAKKETTPFYGADDEEQIEKSLEMDAVDTAQTLSHLPLNLVFDADDDFNFCGSLGGIDISDIT
ncbi:hypothetical protein BG000_002632 [Podila horticola]|nr:hypothetical protein BG000_002632 [Podila horticola]